MLLDGVWRFMIELWDSGEKNPVLAVIPDAPVKKASPI
jgi:hypothetical protein